MRIAIGLVLLLACTPASAPAPAARPADDRPARALPAELTGVLESWHPFDPALAEASPVWLLTRYEPGTYPCRPGPDGSLDMILQDRFTILRVLRGEVAAPGVDLDLWGLRDRPSPRGFAEGRRYVLFLRPGPEVQAVLADREALGRMSDRIDAGHVLAVVDVDASAAEAEAEALAASRSGEFKGVRWTPDLWAAWRAATAVEPASQRDLATFLEGQVLRPGAALADVRAWLGQPDSERLGPGQARTDDYVLARPAYATPVQDALYGQLRLGYGARLQLRTVELYYLRWRVRPREQSSVALTLAEHQALGLPRLAIEFR